MGPVVNWNGADGAWRIFFPLLNELRAAGLTPDELEIVLTQELRRYIRDPQVSVKENPFQRPCKELHEIAREPVYAGFSD